jgi:hypothetical protein
MEEMRFAEGCSAEMGEVRPLRFGFERASGVEFARCLRSGLGRGFRGDAIDQVVPRSEVGISGPRMPALSYPSRDGTHCVRNELVSSRQVRVTGVP